MDKEMEETINHIGACNIYQACNYLNKRLLNYKYSDSFVLDELPNIIGLLNDMFIEADRTIDVFIYALDKDGKKLPGAEVAAKAHMIIVTEADGPQESNGSLPVIL